ncbi:ubiquinol-cytochrome c reductase iron-sulfur subunit [Waterburya agarophytonicola K14]|uniref:Ubiquinol-cytochrome c reductase iron-sulfur subunit n=1 Tax=Waterburya agarophytonicola KI4 TaxID=2874699 RepID=A0A964BM14_9CYAN|nr:ubiquinol-cytochrome c reductase iron-sulfur subunit [Waterburya agarophytonicola]MCC0175879.1 ubiquinol-cytochrome c reductase iron-sulfur subunit [Waterburya agarophytonicola KI4]
MKRREFTSFVGVGVGMSILPTALTACDAQTKNKATAEIATSGGSFEEVGSVSELEQTGQILNEELANGAALVIKDPINADKLIAVNPTCPHAGCAVTWESDQQKFLCPCHDSEFSSSGEVLEAPATEPLTRYEVKVEGDSILVKTT